MISQNERAVLLLRMMGEATRNDILNPETVYNALNNQLSISELLFVRMACELVVDTYEKLLREKGQTQGEWKRASNG